MMALHLGSKAEQWLLPLRSSVVFKEAMVGVSALLILVGDVLKVKNQPRGEGMKILREAYHIRQRQE